jgi:hypothetical protein
MLKRISYFGGSVRREVVREVGSRKIQRNTVRIFKHRELKLNVLLRNE